MCFADKNSGKIIVVAILPDYEGHGIGKQLLQLTLNMSMGLFSIYCKRWLLLTILLTKLVNTFGTLLFVTKKESVYYRNGSDLGIY
jgi:GNAT superfamily N-acetyltransferase